MSELDQLLKNGQTITTESGVACTVEKSLGIHRHGEVYQIRCRDRQMAVKWYFYGNTLEEEKRTRLLIAKGSPDERFLWPEDIATARNVPGFGTILPSTEERFVPLVNLITRKVHTNFAALATAGLQLAESFEALHTKGLCYCDFGLASLLFDPTTGEVRLRDNDDIVLEHTTGAGYSTAVFSAPEIVLGEASHNAITDQYALALILFHMFFLAHPLDGEKEYNIHCKDVNAQYLLYGEKPVFIFDPDDSSNRPVPGFHDNAIIYWQIYPKFFKDVFTRAFTAGLKDPLQRVTEPEWKSAMIKLKNSIIYCPCGAQNFYDPERMKATGGKPGNCWHCNKELPLPPRIRIGNDIVMLNFDTKLYPHHVDDKRQFDFSRPVAEVSKHPTMPGVWGLKNLTNDRWTVITSDGTAREVEPGRNVPISIGIKVNFGKKEGEIRA